MWIWQPELRGLWAAWVPSLLLCQPAATCIDWLRGLGTSPHSWEWGEEGQKSDRSHHVLQHGHLKLPNPDRIHSVCAGGRQVPFLSKEALQSSKWKEPKSMLDTLHVSQQGLCSWFATPLRVFGALTTTGLHPCPSPGICSSKKKK